MASREEVHEIMDSVDFTGKFRETEHGWWIAYCEEVPEARTQGKTKDEALENLRDAIAFILEDYSVEELEDLRARLITGQRETLTL